jgi:predicted dehydrogenase
MTAHPKYAIVGKGLWANVMHGILAEKSDVAFVEGTRRGWHENDDEYQERMGESLLRTGARAVWICVPPSPNTLTLVAAAVNYGMNVVAEKPWLWEGSACNELASQAKANGVLIGVHYEYCMLEAVQTWRSQQRTGGRLKFQGRFRTSRPDRLGLPPTDNLGSHLFAIWAFAVPRAEIVNVDCGYGEMDERLVSVEDEEGHVATIDFTRNTERIIQRFITLFEAAFGGNDFPFDLNFAMRVLRAMDEYKSGISESPL